MSKEVATRFIGTCPVCEGEFKLTEAPHELVLHGYKRPGDGQAHGRCFGFKEAPYELSAVGCERFRAWCAERCGRAEERLRALRAGEVKEFWFRSLSSSAVTPVTIPDIRFPKALVSAEMDAERDITHFGYEIRRMERLIAAWKPSEVKTVEEETARLAKESAERKGARQAERKAKLDAKIVSYQKRIDSAAKKGKKSTLLDIFDSITYNRHKLGNDLTREEALALVEREAVWVKLGVLVDGKILTDRAAFSAIQHAAYLEQQG